MDLLGLSGIQRQPLHLTAVHQNTEVVRVVTAGVGRHLDVVRSHRVLLQQTRDMDRLIIITSLIRPKTKRF